MKNKRKRERKVTRTKKASKLGSFRSILYDLRNELPPEFPVEVRRISISEPDTAGFCKYDKKAKRFVIRIHKDESEGAAIHLLIHEWAHALTWFTPYETEDHGPEWAIAYGKCWNVYCSSEELDEDLLDGETEN